jgi:hypothetical protein
MIERIEGMPAGLGRLFFVLTDFDGLEARAVAEDFKTGLQVWFRDHSAWKRFALVTDVEWVAKAMHMFTWLTPGEVLIGDLGGLEENSGVGLVPPSPWLLEGVAP